MTLPGCMGFEVLFWVSSQGDGAWLQFRAAICPIPDEFLVKKAGAASAMVISPLASTWEVVASTTLNCAVPAVGASIGTTKLIWLGPTYARGDATPFNSTCTPPNVVGTGRTLLLVTVSGSL